MFRVQIDTQPRTRPTDTQPPMWRDLRTEGGAPYVFATYEEADRTRRGYYPQNPSRVVAGLDERDSELLAQRIAARAALAGPLVGDIVEFMDGRRGRFSYDWGDDIQWSPHGSFYFGKDGRADFSGGLNPPIPKAALTDAGETRDASFWFFHHDHTGAHRGVNVVAPCRVYRAAPGA